MCPVTSLSRSASWKCRRHVEAHQAGSACACAYNRQDTSRPSFCHPGNPRLCPPKASSGRSSQMYALNHRLDLHTNNKCDHQITGTSRWMKGGAGCRRSSLQMVEVRVPCVQVTPTIHLSLMILFRKHATSITTYLQTPEPPSHCHAPHPRTLHARIRSSTDPNRPHHNYHHHRPEHSTSHTA